VSKFERYDKFQESQHVQGPKIHPIWRGIGCVMLVLLPIIAYAAADTFFDSADRLVLFNSTIFPSSGIVSRVLISIPLWGDTVLRVSIFHIVFMLLFSILAYLIFSFVYALIYRVTGPPKYGPTDAPPIPRSRRRRK
jgi:hypothetical protein